MIPPVKFSLDDIKREIHQYHNPTRAIHSLRFFKTAKGEYGYGDIFLGLTNPECHRIAKIYQGLPRSIVKSLLKSPIHEHRLIALLILIYQFKNGDQSTRTDIYNLYLRSTKFINNWDLVDSSADKIIGEYLVDKDRQILKKLASSELLWDRRIAIIATFAFIKRGDPKTTFEISKMLLSDNQDLLHKAVGWMLREVGKRCGQEIEEQFLRSTYHKMPRTMLRYAIERFPESLRLSYLHGTAR
jgi:3-methyladenine DNA glycosylase AlkD